MTAPPPPHAGIGLKPEHYRAVRECGDAGLWLEVHPENYMTDGGPRLAWLELIRADKDVSLHGVGMSLGGDEPLDVDHLKRWADLVGRFDPVRISEHVAWSRRGGVYYADLFPLPTTREALDRLCANIDQMQTALGRRILIENPSLYVPLARELDEPEFLVEACRRTGCGLLLDVNNVYVSAHNMRRDAGAYLDAIPADLVGEIHLAGHAADAGGRDLLIDSHGAPVADAVWALYAHALARVGPQPTLIERDADIPSFDVLMEERGRAETALTAAKEPVHV